MMKVEWGLCCVMYGLYLSNNLGYMHGLSGAFALDRLRTVCPVGASGSCIYKILECKLLSETRDEFNTKGGALLHMRIL
jgi:hypothetical protein